MCTNDELTEIHRATSELNRTAAAGERLFRVVVVPAIVASLIILFVLAVA